MARRAAQAIDHSVPLPGVPQVLFKRAERRRHDVAMMNGWADDPYSLHPEIVNALDVRAGQVRRMCAAVGHPVRALERVRFGPLELGDLAPGAHRRLAAAEVERLRQAAPSRP